MTSPAEPSSTGHAKAGHVPDGQIQHGPARTVPDPAAPGGAGAAGTGAAAAGAALSASAAGAPVPGAGPASASPPPSPRPARPRAGPLTGFSPFRSAAYRALFLGTTLTMAGYFAQTVAQGWLIYDLTGSPTWLGIVAFANGIPMLFFALPAGVLVDRFDRRKILALAQGLIAVTTFLLAGLIWTERVEAWHVAALSFAIGCFFVLIVPARQALLPTTVERPVLGAAIGLMSAGTNFGRVIGPALAGVTIAALGAGAAFGVQGIGFIGALVAALMLPAWSATRSRPRQSSPFQSLLEGLRYVWQDRRVFGLMVLQAVPAFLIMPYNQLLPIFARDILAAGPEGLGVLMTAMGVGSVAGSVVVVLLPNRRQGLVLFASLAILSGLLVGFSFSTSFLLSAGLMALVGVAQAIYLAINNTLVQLAVPDALQGRVMSVYMTTWGLVPLGALPQGILSDWFGAPMVLAGAGILSCVMVAVLAASNRELRRL